MHLTKNGEGKCKSKILSATLNARQWQQQKKKEKRRLGLHYNLCILLPSSRSLALCLTFSLSLFVCARTHNAAATPSRIRAVRRRKLNESTERMGDVCHTHRVIYFIVLIHSVHDAQPIYQRWSGGAELTFSVVKKKEPKKGWSDGTHTYIHNQRRKNKNEHKWNVHTEGWHTEWTITI